MASAYPWHRSGEGAGPAIWAVVSTPLLNVLREKGFGCDIFCPLSSSYLKFVGYAFVNDTHVIQLALTETPDQTRIQLQSAIDTWEFSLKTTCGALVLEKTVWWLVSFLWEGGSWCYTGIQNSPGEVSVNDLHNDRKVLKRLEPHQAYETLDVFLAPDGNLSEQFNKMRVAAVQWADGIRTGNLHKEEVWIALQSTILRTLAYPLLALRLTKEQCEAILSPILHYCLPALGICRYFPRRLIFSTYDYLGLNFQHLSTLQEMGRLKDIIFHTFNDTLTGKLYRTSLEVFIKELGLCPYNQKLVTPTVTNAFTTDSLIKASMLFITQHNIVQSMR